MPDYPKSLPMPGYLDVLSALHRIEKPRNYLEIGVADGRTHLLASRRTKCVGVDPEPRVSWQVEQRCQVERVTSDEFFASGLLKQHLGDAPIDLVFVDGMHLFEYALRDFINIERHSDGHTLVIIHDLLPKNEVTAARERSHIEWSGDVWKLLLLLCDRRPDLEICLLDAPPSGLGLVRGLDASNTVLGSSYDDLLAQYGGLTFADWEERRRELVPNLLNSPESRRWRRRIMRRISLSIWVRRASHPVRSLRGLATQDSPILRGLRRFVSTLSKGESRLMSANPRYAAYSIGRGSYGAPTIRSWGEDATLTIGAFCSFADGVRIFLGGEHRSDWVTTYPFSVLWPSARKYPGHPATKGDVRIGNDVLISSGVTILSGVTIGNGAILGANSLVSRDVQPYEVVAGNPARHLRFRFSSEAITALQEIAWWDWPDDKIEEAMPFLLSGDIASFISRYQDPWG